MLQKKTVAILGAGTMGQAILGGLLAHGHPRGRVRATTRTRPAADTVARERGVRVGTDNVAAAMGADIVVLCLKPANVVPVCRSLAEAKALKRGALVVSIAAGVKTEAIAGALGDRVPVIRAMPNTPCAIGRGMTVLSRGPNASESHAALALKIFAPLGRALELEEKHMDTVTGLSASGPAFVFVMIEALADGGVARGLPRQVAIEMAAQMVFGAASMVLESGRHPAALKDDVTTPAGCTIAGILALEDGRIRSVLSRAVEVASVRAGELGGPKS
ncbi:MAG TPA: pyrroline-5-carboxylate reductase [Vicinamibacteria bacterium]|nr:pyrroline-5-carboxylate reductase [Vicinamibacteria bacterium]